MSVVVFLTLCLCCSVSLAEFPFIYHGNNTLEGEEGACPPAGQLNAAISQLYDDIDMILSNTVIPELERRIRYTCGGTSGWQRVVFINMTDSSTSCPSGLQLTSHSKRTCGRAHTREGCSSTTFSVGGSQYSQVCGRIRGYQVGETSAFSGYLGGFYYWPSRPSETIEGYYVDGVSLTHGAAGSRQHIWTFASGISEERTVNNYVTACPCDSPSSQTVPPPFVGNDYFCESGVNGPWPGTSAWATIFPNDPLWDGQGCLSTSTCCQFNNPPWFTKTLPSSTTDDIELRLCTDRWISVDDTPLELIELYIK